MAQDEPGASGRSAHASPLVPHAPARDRALLLHSRTPPHTATAAKLGQMAAPPRTRDSRTPDV